MNVYGSQNSGKKMETTIFFIKIHLVFDFQELIRLKLMQSWRYKKRTSSLCINISLKWIFELENVTGSTHISTIPV